MTSSDLVLVAEVADSSLRFDRDVKLPLYAGAGIPEVWIVDVATGTVEVHRDPRGDKYTAIQRVGADAAVRLPWGGELLVDHILHGPEESPTG